MSALNRREFLATVGALTVGTLLPAGAPNSDQVAFGGRFSLADWDINYGQKLSRFWSGERLYYRADFPSLRLTFRGTVFCDIPDIRTIGAFVVPDNYNGDVILDGVADWASYYTTRKVTDNLKALISFLYAARRTYEVERPDFVALDENFYNSDPLGRLLVAYDGMPSDLPACSDGKELAATGQFNTRTQHPEGVCVSLEGANQSFFAR